MKALALMATSLFLASAVLAASPTATPSATKSSWGFDGYEIHSWGGMQTGRGGALDTGLGLVGCFGRGRLGGQMAQNRIGICGGFRSLGLNCLKDTRVSGLTKGWAPGVYVALSF